MFVDGNGGASATHIQSYGPAGFRVQNADYPHSILVSEQGVLPLEVSTLESLSLDALEPLLARTPRIEVLIIGTGARLQAIPAPLKAALRAQGINSDAMDTGAACRTYTILQSEGRRAGAVLLLPQ